MGWLKRKYAWFKRVFWGKFKDSLSFLYKKLRLEKVIFFGFFFLHRYHPRAFNPLHAKKNVKTLTQLQPGEELSCNSSGELKIGKVSTVKNFLSIGALQSRVERVVFFSFLTMTLELNNPFDKVTLNLCLERKISFLERLLEKIKRINGRDWNREGILIHMDVYRRNSLFQQVIIDQMHQAVRRQKEPGVIKDAKKAISKGLYPVLIVKGLSGAYWIRGTDREVVGLFKPFDEEIRAPNNPVGPQFQGALGLRKTRYGCRVGEAAHHEVAAYLIDEFFGFGIVPKTYYATFTHRTFFHAREARYEQQKTKTKYGSFQEFLSGFVSLEDLSREDFAEIPLDEFQLLVVLDVIIGNTDRNTGNFLFGEEKLAAIDHGLCFPDVHDEYTYWYWSYFDQGREHFLTSIVELLKSFPFEKLAWKLKRECFISPNAIDRMRERLALFTEGVLAGLTPSHLEDLMTLDYLEPLEGYNSTLNQRTAQQLLKYLNTYYPFTG